MKKILAMAAVAALAAGASVYAANPFSDVSTSDWAYQAVSDLSDQGVVEGYPDGTFKGQNNITRFEMAQIIARLMAKEDQLNAEQRATLDKLAGEYADELDSLGVRVSNLEKKVGNISWSGDARMQYQRNLDAEGADPATDKADSYAGRIRLNVSGQVNDQVTVEGRLVSEADLKGGDSANTEMDRIHVVYTPSETFTLDLGRTGVGLSQTGIFMDEDGVFDGVAATYDNGKFNFGAGYGRFQDVNFNETGVESKDYSEEAWFVKAGTNVADKVDLSAFYLQYAKNKELGANDNIAVYGVGAAFQLADKVTLDGDYIKHADDTTNDASLWTAGLTYGEVDTDKVGTFSVGVHYADLDKKAYIGGNSAWDLTDQLDYLNATGGSFWQAKVGVAVAKGVELDAYYSFAASADNGAKDPDDTFGVELNYAF